VGIVTVSLASSAMYLRVRVGQYCSHNILDAYIYTVHFCREQAM
jgi:hypothetical protein